jgi:Cytochrome c7 and related cytochrome c
MPSYAARERASRIPLDYYKKPDRLSNWKKALTWGALGITGLWIVTVFVGGKTPLGTERFSHGAVSRAHAPIESDCSKCHVSFGLMSNKGTINEKCQTCHLEPPRDVHHPDQKQSMTPNCGTCHTDHKGRDFSLVHVAESRCTACHQDLKNAMEGQPIYETKITNFPTDHPDFRSLKRPDPGKLKFNHKYHMTEGIVLLPGGEPFRVRNIVGDSQRKRFGTDNGSKLDDAVKLKCSNCHEPEQGDVPGRPPASADPEEIRKFFADRQIDREPRLKTGELQPPHKAGKYMKAITYAEHCRGCHQNTFDPKLVIGGIPLEVPHRSEKDRQGQEHLQPDGLRNWLHGVYEIEFSRNPEYLARELDTLFPLPGKSLTPPEPTESLVGKKVEQAMRLLLEGKRACGECHIDTRGRDLTVLTTEIATPRPPTVWLEHARFFHNKHTERDISCQECHPAAYPPNDPEKRRLEILEAFYSPLKGAEVVMIQGIDNCKQCHSPTPDPKDVERGLTARSDCTECHSYHQGEANPAKKAMLPGHGLQAFNKRGAPEGLLNTELAEWLRPRRK